jgi:hypothetical protein
MSSPFDPCKRSRIKCFSSGSPLQKQRFVSSTQRQYPVQETVLAALEQADPTLKTPPPGITAKPKGGVVDNLQLMPAASGYRTAYVRFADERARKHVLKHDWGGRCVRDAHSSHRC